MQQKTAAHILPVIVLSQFAGTSLWFAGNAILPDIQQEIHLGPGIIANITSAVQFGFIAGTFVFALLSVADRFHPSKVFFTCSLLAAAANAGVALSGATESSFIAFRFITGFFLAGIYPVGMKIAADWFEKGLGKALGFLVGALVLGTAFPHLLEGTAHHFNWRSVIYATSAVAMAGGLLMILFVPNGPYRKRGQSFHPAAIVKIFQSKKFNAAVFGYFGHMWELYALWAFVPVLLQMHQQNNGTVHNIPLWSFIIIGIGGLSCVAGGYLSQKWGNAKVAFYALLVSGACCCACYFLLQAPSFLFLSFMVIWGIAVTPDSPQFSTLVAQTAPLDHKGTALTLVTSLGFAITIVSIQILNYLFHRYHSGLLFLLLAIGPLLGLKALYGLIKRP